jgi:ABC-type uncharacterized transport system substrate-binding protein
VRPILRAAVLLLVSATGTAAHPHVWVVGTTDILFDAQGRITGLRQNWTFDEMYSAFATQGLGEKGKPPSRETLAPLAQTNVESLAEFGYFTAARESGKALEFGAPKDYWLEADDNLIVRLHFTLPLKAPVEAKKPFSFQTYDPTYFVDFTTEKTDPARLVDAPKGCSLSALKPPPLIAADQAKLTAAASDNFSPGASLSMQLATRIVVACP